MAERAGLSDAFAAAPDPEIIERVPGASSTDFWGIAHVPSQIEREVLASADLERRLGLLQACWAEFDVVQTPDGLASHRRDYLDAMRAWNAEGRSARTWPIQFFVRRTAHHVMDHAWEMQDRDPAGGRP